MLCGNLAPQHLLHFLAFGAFQVKTSFMPIHLFIHAFKVPGTQPPTAQKHYITDIDIISDYVTENYTNLSYNII